MSHLLDVRKTVIDQKREFVRDQLSYLIRKREDLVLSIVGKGNENKLDTLTDVFKSDPTNPTVKALNKLVADLANAEAKYFEFEYRSLIYKEPINAEIKLNADSIEHEKSMLYELISYCEAKKTSGKENKSVIRFLYEVFGVKRPSDEMVKILTEISYDSFIDECYRVLDVIKQIESNNLMSDNKEYTTSISSCVGDLQKLGIHITTSEFINVVNSNVWSTDKENGYDKLVKFDEKKEDDT